MFQRGALIAAVAVVVLVPGARANAAVANESLPSVASGARPGPDILYAARAKAPQLQNRAPWKADPILVSGTQAYRDGEYLYQDYLYDDHGAIGVPDPNSPYSDNADLFSPPAGTFTYPTNPVYAGNAADLVEFRVKPLRNETAFRVTLNALKDPALTGFTIAIGDSGSAVAWPHGAGVSSPAQRFLTVHGTTAELLDAATDRAVTPAPTAKVDLDSRQVDVRVPHEAWDPGTSTVRMTIGTGLWDPSSNGYLAAQPGSASESAPGGGGPGAAIVNVGPRFDEPWPSPTNPAPPYTIADAAVGAQVQSAWWREHNQAMALTSGDVSQFHADVDFAKLAADADDDSGVPASGPMDRILASRYSFGQGYDASKVCFDLGSNFSAGADCIGRMVGQLQPYAIYVPKTPRPADGYGMTLLLHSLSANYNQYATSKNQSELGDRDGGSIVVTPSGRGPDGFYAGIAEADTFEVWADVGRRYRLDPEWSVVSGYSMGGFGTYRLLARWPDLFARGFSVVGVPGAVNDQLPSLRNTPILLWNATADELVNITESEQAVADLTSAGLRFIEWLFPTADHLTLATNDEYGPGADWLGNHRVDLNPPHVSYVVDPTEDNAQATAVADHAYWLSGLELRDPKTESHIGTIDARSDGFGVGDPTPTGQQQSGGALMGGAHGPMPYVERSQDWGPAPSEPVADRLDLDATNIRSATVAATRARLSCSPKLNIKTDGPLNLTIDCSQSGATRLPRVQAVAVSGAKRRAFTVRVNVVRTSKRGKTRTVSLVRSVRAAG